MEEQAIVYGSTPVEAPPRVAAASASDNESLYEQLLRHHLDNNLDDSDTIDVVSIQSEEDRKLPALPRRGAHVRQPRPNYLHDASNHRISESELSPKPTPTKALAEDPVRNGATPENISVPESGEQGQTSGGSLGINRSKLLPESRRQSSFYMAALEAAGETDPPHVLQPNDLEQDELIARELEQQLQEPPPHTVLDEELARALQAAQDAHQPLDTEEQDVALALQLMQQEQQQQYKHPNNTLDDEQLAISLSKQMAFGTDPDELFARQLSQCDHAFPLSEPSRMVPEQLQILERIQQDKERQLIQQAINESSLRELPAFQEFPDMLGGSSRSETFVEDDYRLSQELAFREWTPAQGMRHGHGALQNDRLQGLRSSQTWSTNDPSVSSAPRMMSQHFGANSASSVQSDRSLRANFTPGRAVSVTPSGEETSIQPRSQILVARSQSNLPSTREPVTAARRTSSVEGARSNIIVETHPEQRRNSAQFTGSWQGGNPSLVLQPDIPRSRPTDELLLRGNQETQVAIATGRAHVVVCQGCRSHLHAPRSYSLVFCPTCNTISPGQLADTESGSISSGGGRNR